MNGLINAIFGNWKTSALGLAEGVVVGMVVNHLSFGDALHASWQAFAAGLPFLLKGIAAKDATTGSQAIKS